MNSQTYSESNSLLVNIVQLNTKVLISSKRQLGLIMLRAV